MKIASDATKASYALNIADALGYAGGASNIEYTMENTPSDSNLVVNSAKGVLALAGIEDSQFNGNLEIKNEDGTPTLYADSIGTYNKTITATIPSDKSHKATAKSVKFSIVVTKAEPARTIIIHSSGSSFVDKEFDIGNCTNWTEFVNAYSSQFNLFGSQKYVRFISPTTGDDLNVFKIQDSASLSDRLKATDSFAAGTYYTL